ncbi:sugar phosphate isomerase/epimerase family protein [uncultured Cyclobacterium sp.]|uniref:sugar phosphate isomerase/epimerase family protein n=1 Tax=uncultured Cyclobacterium sp. TaxID=453820 RepID=UPI0030EC604E
MGLVALTMPELPAFFDKTKLGIVVHSYGKRWHSSHQSNNYPGFIDASELLRHCHDIGAGGIQVGVNGWTEDFTKKIRAQRERLGMYLEGSIGMPKKEADLADFEKQVILAKEAGIKILRTVSLGPRRYEALHSQEAFLTFQKQATNMLGKTERLLRKHKVKLAIENHKDWRANELAQLMKGISSEWVGVTLDFGNSIALMEQPEHTLQLLAPYVFSTHVKDMAVTPHSEGFQLSEVPLGEGLIDLKKIINTCKEHNPSITFNLEMITRNPLLIPCLTPAYWTTLGQVPASELAEMLTWVNSNGSILPSVNSLGPEALLAIEEKNVLTSLAYSNKNLNL